MTAPANATPLERMLDAVVKLSMVASAVRDGVYDDRDGTPNYLARSAALLLAADACETERKTAAERIGPTHTSLGHLFDEAYECGRYEDEDLREVCKRKAHIIQIELLEDGRADGMRRAATIISQVETPPAPIGVALALANLRTVMQREIESHAARCFITKTTKEAGK